MHSQYPTDRRNVHRRIVGHIPAREFSSWLNRGEEEPYSGSTTAGPVVRGHHISRAQTEDPHPVSESRTTREVTGIDNRRGSKETSRDTIKWVES
jgi:hypothetical protein